MDKKVFDELEKINKNNKNDKESLFPEHEFLASCLRINLTISDLKILTYIDVLKIFISFLRRKRRSPKRCKRSNTRRYTKFSCKNVGGRKMAGTIKGIIVEIGGDTSGLQKALSSINTATSSLTKELRGINSLLKLDPSNTELLAQKQTVLTKNIEETSNKLEVLKKTQEEADNAMANGTDISEENYRNLQREIINTENKLKQLQLEASNWTQAGKKIEEFGEKVTNISSKIDTLGSTLTTSLTLPVLAIGTAAVTAGNDFEAQMSRVQAIAGATKDELKQLTDQAIQLGAETTFSASEVAEGMENLASAGFNTNEIMEAMPGLLDLAASSGAELATSSEIAARAIRGFGLEADKTGHVADVFAEAAARTNAQTEDMGEAMKYVAPVAKTVGLSIEETAAAIGIMSDAGVKGSQAGTTLRGGLTRIVKPTKMVRDAMEELGVEFYDSNGKMKSLTEIIKTLQDHTKGLTDETKNQALAQIFGTEALSGMLALVNRGSDELADMTKSFENCDGAAEKMADTMLDNTKGAFESLSGSLESAGIAIQQTLAPHIKDLAKEIQDLVDDFNDLSDEQKDNVIKTALLVAAIGPAVKILGTLGKGVGTATKGIGTLSQAIGVFRTGAQSANTTANILAKGINFLASPVGLVTVAVGALAAALLYLSAKQSESSKKAKEFEEDMKAYKESYEQYNESIDKTTNSNLAQIDSVERLSEELKTLVDENGKVKEGYKSRVDFILNELNSALGTEYKLNGDIVQSYKNLQSEIDKTIEKKKAEIILNSKEEKYTNAINTETEAVEKLKEARDNLGMSYEDAKKKVEDYYTAIKEGTISADDALSQNDEIENLKTYMTAYEDAESVVKQCVEDRKSYENDYALFIEGKYAEIGKTVTESTKNWTDASLTEIRDGILLEQQNLQKYKDLYETTGSEIAQQQQQQAQQNLKNLADELVARTSTIGSLGSQEILAWSTLANNSYDTYKEAISKMSPEMQNEIQSITGVIANNLTMQDETANKAGQMTDNFKQKLKLSGYTDEQIKEIASNLENNTTVPDNAGELANKAETKFEENDSKTWGSDMVEGIGEGIQEKGNSQWFKGILGGLSGLIASFLHFSRPDVGPLREYEKWMPDMIEGLSKTLDESSYKLLNSARNLSNNLYKEMDFGNFAKEINGQITTKTQMIYTTPTLNIYTQGEVNIRKIADEVNRIFGSKY